MPYCCDDDETDDDGNRKPSEPPEGGCEKCGDSDAEWTIDPFAAEVDYRKIWVYFCLRCYRNSADDI